MMKKVWTMEDIAGRIDGQDIEAQKIIHENTFDVRNLPAEKNTYGKEDKQFWVSFLIFFIVCAAGPAYLLKSSEFISILPFWAGSFVVGCIFLLFALKKLLFQRMIKVTVDEVTYTHKGLFGKKQWTERLSAYRGVLLQVWIGSKRGKSREIILYHDEEDKRILLFKWGLEETALKAWEAFAKALQLPMLEEKGGEIVEHAPSQGNSDT
jgi:hypothetical protein